MVTEEVLQNALYRLELTRRDKLLLVLATTPDEPKQVAEIKQIAFSAGLRQVKKWNISSILGDSGGLAIRVEGGWLLTDKGRNYLLDSEFVVEIAGAPVPVIIDLRKLLPDISNQDVVEFLEEAIACFDRKLYRAAVVLSWVGAIALLHDHVINFYLAQFNAEATRRDSKWKIAKTSDDLSRMKEHDFLDLLEALSVLGKNVKQELQNNCLKLRNACGHPNSLKISQNRVAAHLEILILNVFSVFK